MNATTSKAFDLVNTSIQDMKSSLDFVETRDGAPDLDVLLTALIMSIDFKEITRFNILQSFIRKQCGVVSVQIAEEI